ncbi:hypothetical protein [Methylobacterium sp. J-077]|uniref:hypothetical protein n=1 Tax=Methylobacterium sp. J-077 TaxID=2836656 RepID=UPI001FB98B9B|nr:hypothetical protein [Methylobacterium sp. J-077]MCJ2123131.1 hypothetical protein [Methylobacterium sp. J-077]
MCRVLIIPRWPPMRFCDGLFTLPGLFMLPSALPPPAGVWAKATPVTATTSAAARASAFIDMAFSSGRIGSIGPGLNVAEVGIVQTAKNKPLPRINSSTSASLRTTSA